VLLDYAAKHWYEHAKMAHEKEPPVTLAVQLLDYQESSSFLYWLRIWDPDRP
jgi:hypothetical protein